MNKMEEIKQKKAMLAKIDFIAAGNPRQLRHATFCDKTLVTPSATTIMETEKV